jgi:hypothetical protein
MGFTGYERLTNQEERGLQELNRNFNTEHNEKQINIYMPKT